MDDARLNEVFEVNDADFAPTEAAAERLPVLTLGEAHEIPGILLNVAQGADEHPDVARRLAHELAARIPSAASPAAVNHLRHIQYRNSLSAPFRRQG